MRTLVPDDKDWEQSAATDFGWFCWIYNESFGMTDVAEDANAPGKIECAALWEPAGLTVGAGLRFFLFFLYMLYAKGFAYAKKQRDRDSVTVAVRQ